MKQVLQNEEKFPMQTVLNTAVWIYLLMKHSPKFKAPWAWKISFLGDIESLRSEQMSVEMELAFSAVDFATSAMQFSNNSNRSEGVLP